MVTLLISDGSGRLRVIDCGNLSALFHLVCHMVDGEPSKTLAATSYPPSLSSLVATAVIAFSDPLSVNIGADHLF